MKYTVEHKSKDIAKALGLSKDQKTRIDNAIQKAYNQQFHHLGPNIDQINGFVAPYIKTPEEGFYAATVIITEVVGAINDYATSKNAN